MISPTENRDVPHFPRYSPMAGLPGVEILAAERLQLQFDRHFHDSYSFGLVLDGVEHCYLGGATHFFEPGTVPLFNPGEVHDGGPATDGGWSYRMVYVEPTMVEGERLFTTAARRDALAQGRVRSLFDAIDHGSLLGMEESLHLALETLLEARADAAGPAPHALTRVRERLDADCCEPLRLRDLCAMAGLSPTRLLRAFSAAYGLTPHRFQQSRRIAAAKKLILDGLPLAEVAIACGYADQSHLNRWFLRIHGTTPGRYRRAFFS